MFNYYLKLAWLSVRMTPGLSLLMVLAIAIGIATCLTTLTMYSVISSNPMSHKNDSIFALQLDSWGGATPFTRTENQMPYQITYKDAKAILEADVAEDVVVMMRSGFFMSVPESGVEDAVQRGRITTSDFFKVFDVPFIFGGAWSHEVDLNMQNVVVISEEVNNRYFKGENSVGRTIFLEERPFTISGVVADEWRLLPSLHDLNNGFYDLPPLVYMPFSVMAISEMANWGIIRNWQTDVDIRTYADKLQSETVWLQAWIGVASAQQKAEFESFLTQYITREKQKGRFPHPLKFALNSPQEWLVINKTVGNDTRILLGLSFAFLLVCLVNSVVLLLAKFYKKAPEAGVRRALGATQYSIFIQHLAEACVIAVAGGVLGMVFSWLGLAGVRSLYSEYTYVASLSVVTITAALVLAFISSLASGVLPALQISRTQPSHYLKAQ